MTDWGAQRAIFANDDAWQRHMRDTILKPDFYETFYPNNYEFIEHTDKRARGGIDTIANGKTIDEKIVRWPRTKTGAPALQCYSAFALETQSCTTKGHERDGWMKTNKVDFILYCFADRNELALSCYLIDFPILQEWFFANVDKLKCPHWYSNQANRTECRVVQISDVVNAVPTQHNVFVNWEAVRLDERRTA